MAFYSSEGSDGHAAPCYHDEFKPDFNVEWSHDERGTGHVGVVAGQSHDDEDADSVNEELDMIANLISKDQLFLKREVDSEAGGAPSPSSSDRFSGGGGHSLHASASRSTTTNNGVVRQCTSNDTDSPGSCGASPAANDMHSLHGNGGMQQMHHILQQHTTNGQQQQQQQQQLQQQQQHQQQQQLLQQQQQQQQQHQQHNGNANGTNGLFHSVYQSPVDITGFLQFKTEAGSFDMSNFLGMSSHFPNVSLASPGGVPLNSLPFGAAAVAASSQPMMHHLNVQQQQPQAQPPQTSAVVGQQSAGGSTSTSSAPKKTRTRHSNDNMIKCQFCPKKFTLEQIDNHRNECRLIRCHECTQCGKRFKARGGLQQHNRIHLQERHYACNYCTKRFTQKSHLDQHERIHTGMKPFSCQYCGRSFRQRSQQLGHEATHPPGSSSQAIPSQNNGHHQGAPTMVLNTSSGSSSGVFSTNTTASDQSSLSDNVSLVVPAGIDRLSLNAGRFQSLDSSPSGVPSQVIQSTAADHLNQVAIQQAAVAAHNNAMLSMLAPNGSLSIKQELLSGR